MAVIDGLPRPIHFLQDAMYDYPDLPSWVDTFRSRHAKRLSFDWPDWCFLPMSAFYAMICRRYDVPVLDIDLVRNLAPLAAIGTWRYTQGIYQIDPDLRTALTETDITGDLPAAVMLRLPEYALYIETPGMTYGDGELHGFFAHLEYDRKTDHTELRLVLDADRGLIGVPVHLGDMTLTESMQLMFDEGDRNVPGFARVVGTDGAKLAADIVQPIVSILLYLCSQEPDIDQDRVPGESPTRPEPVKTKRGWRLFPPDRPTYWTVGERIGAKLRQDRRDYEATGRTVRPHIRRGHYHLFWTGPRTGDRTYVVHWLPPMLVAAGDDDE